jgi:hypothetical protein
MERFKGWNLLRQHNVIMDAIFPMGYPIPNLGQYDLETSSGVLARELEHPAFCPAIDLPHPYPTKISVVGRCRVIQVRAYFRGNFAALPLVAGVSDRP